MTEEILIIGLDLDGTLYTLTPEIKKRQRVKIYENISYEFGVSFEKARDLFEENYSRFISSSKTIAEIARKFGKKNYPDIVQKSLEEADFLDLLKPNPNLNEMLIRISKTKRLDLLTGSTYNLVLKTLKKLKIYKYVFCDILTHENGSKSLDLYEKWLKESDFAPHQYLYVGDNKKLDIDIPKRFGIKTCFVGDYDKADFCISNILDLEKIVD